MATIGNTPVHIYLDTPTIRRKCDKEFKVIARMCKPEPEDKDNKPKKKKSGLAGRLSTITEKLDEAGKRAYGYNKRVLGSKPHC